MVGLLALLGAVYLWVASRDATVVRNVSPVTTEPPPVQEPSSFTLDRDGGTIRLSGTVQTASERDALIAATTDAGFEPEVAIAVSENVADSDTRLVAVLLGPLLSGTEGGALSLVDGTVTLTGEAKDPVEAELLAEAIDTALSGGLAVEDQTTVRVLPEAVQIVELQKEIEQIFELARSLEGQSPNFDVSDGALSDGAQDTLDRVAVAMRRYPLPHADIIGHTDSTGSPETNQRLSEARAEVVRLHLIDGGIDDVRLTASGRGDTEPVASNDKEAGRAENRRVDFVVKASGS